MSLGIHGPLFASYCVIVDKSMQMTFQMLILVSMLWLGALGAITTYTATLNGAGTFPPNGSPATGTATLVFDDSTNLATVSITYAGAAFPINDIILSLRTSPTTPFATLPPPYFLPAGTVGPTVTPVFGPVQAALIAGDLFVRV